MYFVRDVLQSGYFPDLNAQFSLSHRVPRERVVGLHKIENKWKNSPRFQFKSPIPHVIHHVNQLPNRGLVRNLGPLDNRCLLMFAASNGPCDIFNLRDVN